MVRLHIRLEEADLYQLKYTADRYGFSRSHIARMAIQAGMPQVKKILKELRQ